MSKYNPNNVLCYTRKTVQRPMTLNYEFTCFRGEFLPEEQRCTEPIQAGQLLLMETAPGLEEDGAGERGLLYSHLETCIPESVARLLPGSQAHGCRLHWADVPEYNRLLERRNAPGGLVARDARDRNKKLAATKIEDKQIRQAASDRERGDIGARMIAEFRAAVAAETAATAKAEKAAAKAAARAAGGIETDESGSEYDSDNMDEDPAPVPKLGKLAENAAQISNDNARNRAPSYEIGSKSLAKKAVMAKKVEAMRVQMEQVVVTRAEARESARGGASSSGSGGAASASADGGDADKSLAAQSARASSSAASSSSAARAAATRASKSSASARMSGSGAGAGASPGTSVSAGVSTRASTRSTRASTRASTSGAASSGPGAGATSEEEEEHAAPSAAASMGPRATRASSSSGASSGRTAAKGKGKGMGKRKNGDGCEGPTVNSGSNKKSRRSVA